MKSIEVLIGRYESAIKKLMKNDRFGTWAGILEECDNNIEDAYKLLIDCLDEALEYYHEEEDECAFYLEVKSELL